MARVDMGLSEYVEMLEKQEQEHLKALEELRIAKSHALRIRGELAREATSSAPERVVPLENVILSGSPYAHLGAEEATYRYLLSATSPQRTAQIRKGILKGGLRSDAKNLHSTVFTSLRRLVEKGKVEKVGKGQWVARKLENRGLLALK